MSKIIKITFLLICTVMSSGSILAYSSMVQDMSPETISDRIKPIGEVSVEGGGAAEAEVAVAKGPLDPAKTYKTYCTICHQAGIAGAPKFRDSTDWVERVKVGIDALTASAIKGKGGMPAKGTCMKCTDEDMKLVIEYMLPQ